MIEFILNNKPIKTIQPSGALLLDFVRYEQSLTGTKIGCREGGDMNNRSLELKLDVVKVIVAHVLFSLVT